MEQIKTLNVAIVGGGPGCKAIMDMIFAEKLSQLRMKLIGVACTNPRAAGYLYAQETGTYTTRDYRDLYKFKDLNMIIELTGREDVADEISRTKPQHVRVMDHVAAHLFWDIFQAEEALRKSEEKYKTLIESSLTGIYIDQDGKITFANNEFAEIYGYSRDELVGMESWRLVHPEDRALTDEMRAKRLKGQEASSRYEARGLTKDNQTIWIARRNTQIEYRGRPAILGNIVDTTEAKRAEKALQEAHDELERRVEERTAELAKTAEQLRLELDRRKLTDEELRIAHKDLAIYADELQAAHEELSRCAYAVSHDLKAPLRTIHHYSDFLGEELEATLNGDQKGYLDNINRIVLQAEELIDALLAFMRISRWSGPAETIDIGVLLKKLIASLDLPSSVEVVLGDNWPTIDADPTLVREIFLHLIRNAVRFNRSPRKRVEIVCRPARGKSYQMSVHDNGIGIESRYYEQIFGAFLRLHTRTEYEGAGVGLAICKKIVERHGGRIWVDSEPGKGSTFYFTIPSAAS
jgi:PAS domain S-box-containing protein